MMAEQTTQAGWTPETLSEIGHRFEGQPVDALLRWGVEQFGSQIALATGFGPEGIALMHHAARVAPAMTIFYLDTGLLFEETYQLRDELETRLGITFTRVSTELSVDAQEEQYGPRLWSYDPNTCCRLRKVEPLRRFLAGRLAWVTAIRRDQTAARANAGLVEWDRSNGLVKLNPLASWTANDVWNYIYEHELPYNRLHLRGYPSIGCWPCTRSVQAGDDPRSGRWSGFSKVECGIHQQPENRL